MHEEIQVVPHVQMAELQRSAQRDYKRRVQRTLRAQDPFLRGFVRHAVFALEDGGRQRFRRNAAGEGRVVVDVEFEEVEELVGYEVDGAVYFSFDAEVEFEGAACLVAHGERNVLELAGGIGDLRMVLAFEGLREEVEVGIVKRRRVSYVFACFAGENVS